MRPSPSRGAGAARGVRGGPFVRAQISDQKYAFPTGYDLIYCRDALMHLPNRLVHQALRNLACSDAAHVLIGSDEPGRGHNWDINTGDWRPLSLKLRPFRLRPERVFLENVDDRPKLSLFLFKAQSLREQLHADCARLNGTQA